VPPGTPTPRRYHPPLEVVLRRQHPKSGPRDRRFSSRGSRRTPRL